MIYHSTTHGKELKLSSNRLYTASDMEHKIRETVAIINQMLHCFGLNIINVESHSSMEEIAVIIRATDGTMEVRRRVIIESNKKEN